MMNYFKKSLLNPKKYLYFLIMMGILEYSPLFGEEAVNKEKEDAETSSTTPEKKGDEKENKEKEDAETSSSTPEKKADDKENKEKKATETSSSIPEKKEKDDGSKEKEEPPKIGNFALPTSQQPAALFGFGGNIIDKDEIQIYFFADYFKGKKKIVTDLIPSFLFGVSDNFSIYFNFPFTPIMKDGRQRSSGIEDFFIQLEYAFYNNSTPLYLDQATIVGNITYPTGSTKKAPPTGFGSPSLFLGATYYHMMVDWFAFAAPGAILTSSNHGTKIGDQFLYQIGFGKNITSPLGWIYAWMIEVDGQYNKRNRINGCIDHQSGGNVIYVTPSIWVSSKEMLFQFGVSIPVNQNLFGHQHKVDYAFNFNFAWAFY